MRQRDMARLDRKIARLMGWRVFWHDLLGRWYMTRGHEARSPVTAYSTDLNATVAACDEAGMHWCLGDGGGSGHLPWASVGDSSVLVDAATPALALSLALMAALEART